MGRYCWNRILEPATLLYVCIDGIQKVENAQSRLTQGKTGNLLLAVGVHGGGLPLGMARFKCSNDVTRIQFLYLSSIL